MLRLLLVVSALVLMAGCSSPEQLPPVPTPTPTLTDVLTRIEPGIVAIRTPAGIGSGFIIDERGSVLTNAHVVGSFLKATVAMKGLGPVETLKVVAEVVGVDEEADLALLSLDLAQQRTHLQFGDSDAVGLAQDVIAAGYPLGNILGEGFTVTRGIVSSMRRIGPLEYIQTDAAVNPGSSGGPLVDSSGRVIGVITIRLDRAQNRPVEGIGLAISINEVKKLLPSLRRSVRPETPSARSYFGQVHDGTNDVEAQMTLRLRQDGETLTGRVSLFPPLEGDGPIRGTVRGRRLDFSASFSLSGRRVTISFTGTSLPEGTLAGTYQIVPTGQAGTWIVYPR